MIFQWMKYITLQDCDINNEEDDIPTIPYEWTDIFASLLTVNRAFFLAGADVLWERMESLVPLLSCVLPSDRDKEGGLRLPPVSLALLSPVMLSLTHRLPFCCRVIKDVK